MWPQFQQRSKEIAQRSRYLRDRQLLLLCAKSAMDSTKTEITLEPNEEGEGSKIKAKFKGMF